MRISAFLFTVFFGSQVTLAQSPAPSQVDSLTQAMTLKGTYLRKGILISPVVLSGPYANVLSAREKDEVANSIQSLFCGFDRFDIYNGPEWMSYDLESKMDSLKSKLPKADDSQDMGIKMFKMIFGDPRSKSYYQSLDSLINQSLGNRLMTILNNPKRASEIATSYLSEAEKNSMVARKAKLSQTELVSDAQMQLVAKTGFLVVPVFDAFYSFPMISKEKGIYGHQVKVSFGFSLYKVENTPQGTALKFQEKILGTTASSMTYDEFKTHAFLSLNFNIEDYLYKDAMGKAFDNLKYAVREVEDFRLSSQVIASQGDKVNLAFRNSEYKDVNLGDKFELVSFSENAQGQLESKRISWAMIDYTDSTKASTRARNEYGSVHWPPEDLCQARTTNKEMVSQYDLEANKMRPARAEAMGKVFPGLVVREIVSAKSDVLFSLQSSNNHFKDAATNTILKDASLFGVEFNFNLAPVFSNPRWYFVLGSQVGFNKYHDSTVTLGNINLGLKRRIWLRNFPIDFSSAWQFQFAEIPILQQLRRGSDTTVSRLDHGLNFGVRSAWAITPNVQLGVYTNITYSLLSDTWTANKSRNNYSDLNIGLSQNKKPIVSLGADIAVDLWPIKKFTQTLTRAFF